MLFNDIKFFQKKSSLKFIMFLAVISFSITSNAQDDKQLKRDIKKSQNYLSEAQQSLQKNEFPSAEADYRKAIAINPKNDTGKYNLGTAYYKKDKNAEAILRFKQAAKSATDKTEKHRAFHNLGNAYMNEKKYQEAVDSYKNALRNNPNDDETRYNLALAKDMLEKNPPPPDNKNDKNKDKDKDKNKDKKDQDKKDNQDKKGDQGDQKDKKDKGDQDKDKKGDQDKNKPDKPKDGEKGDKPQQQQPVPGQLSPQQVKSLLEAMNNEEKKVQEKVNATKEKGAKVKSSKDW